MCKQRAGEGAAALQSSVIRTSFKEAPLPTLVRPYNRLTVPQKTDGSPAALALSLWLPIRSNCWQIHIQSILRKLKPQGCGSSYHVHCGVLCGGKQSPPQRGEPPPSLNGDNPPLGGGVCTIPIGQKTPLIPSFRVKTPVG